jgi:hypothetical protein
MLSLGVKMGYKEDCKTELLIGIDQCRKDAVIDSRYKDVHDLRKIVFNFAQNVVELRSRLIDEYSDVIIGCDCYIDDLYDFYFGDFSDTGIIAYLLRN